LVYTGKRKLSTSSRPKNTHQTKKKRDREGEKKKLESRKALEKSHSRLLPQTAAARDLCAIFGLAHFVALLTNFQCSGGNKHLWQARRTDSVQIIAN